MAKKEITFPCLSDKAGWICSVQVTKLILPEGVQSLEPGVYTGTFKLRENHNEVSRVEVYELEVTLDE